MELIKQQSLMYQQQNAIKWGNSAWTSESSSSAKSLREIQEEEQRRKENELKKREDETRRREEENKRRLEDEGGVDLGWVGQTQSSGGKLSLREIQEQEKKRDKINKEREAAKVTQSSLFIWLILSYHFIYIECC